MFDWLTTRVLRLMRVPHKPDPPLGAPGSVRIFRAGLNHYYLRLARWAIGQSGAFVGIGFSLVFLGALEAHVERARREDALPRVSPTPSAMASPSSGAGATSEMAAPSPSPSLSRNAKFREDRRRARNREMVQLIAGMPAVALTLLRVVEIAGIALFGFQLAVTYALVRLEFEQHWYIVTDRSLRIRTGILRLQESTMSFANIQQVEIRQGPLQRVLGLADVCVRSAGGSDPQQGHAQGAESSLHVGTFKDVTNGVEIRDLILDRLRRFREAGLGDPEDHRPADFANHESPEADSSALGAAEELLNEARALKRAVARG